MRKPDLDAIDEPVPRTLEDRKVVVKSRVEQQSVETGHDEQTRQVKATPVYLCRHLFGFRGTGTYHCQSHEMYNKSLYNQNAATSFYITTNTGLQYCTSSKYETDDFVRKLEGHALK